MTSPNEKIPDAMGNLGFPQQTCKYGQLIAAKQFWSQCRILCFGNVFYMDYMHYICIICMYYVYVLCIQCMYYMYAEAKRNIEKYKHI